MTLGPPEPQYLEDSGLTIAKGTQRRDPNPKSPKLGEHWDSYAERELYKRKNWPPRGYRNCHRAVDNAIGRKSR